MQSLFTQSGKNAVHVPLADSMRPLTLAEYFGQEHLLGPEKILTLAVQAKQIPSMILWGPPGSGKTTLARILAQSTDAEFLQMSAVTGGVKEIREVVKSAQAAKNIGKHTILFIDEIHRFNKSQQDALLPNVENGDLTLIGATTENPSFEVNSALLSRARVFVLKPLSVETLEAVIRRALTDTERGLGKRKLSITNEAITFLATQANGDARTALNALDLAASTGVSIKEALQKSHLLYDKGGEEHYNIISALHKSMRGNDANAALYWLGRMLESGEDPLYITRRLMRFASEDIGLADPNALVQAVAAQHACHAMGMPECNVVLAQCVAYLAKAPKSNALYTAYAQVRDDIQHLPNQGVPLHLRNAPTELMKQLDYGKGYKYTPDFKYAEDAKQDFLPEALKDRKYLQE